MSFLNTNDVDVNVNIDEVLQDGTVTKEKLAEDVQNKIYKPDVVTSNGADLAEVGFWVDNNPENEDRLYRFVSIAGETGREIKIADSNDQIAGTSNIIDNVGFLGGYTDGDENDNTKVIVSIVGVVPVKTNDNTIKANDRVMSDDNGYAVKSTNNYGYRVLEVIEEGLLNIVVSPNTDMIQRIKTDMLENEAKLSFINQEVYQLQGDVDFFSKKIDDKQDKLSTEQINNISAVPNKIDKSQVGNGLKFADGMLQLDIPVASASTTYGGNAQ